MMINELVKVLNVRGLFQLRTDTNVLLTKYVSRGKLGKLTMLEGIGVIGQWTITSFGFAETFAVLLVTFYLSVAL